MRCITLLTLMVSSRNPTLYIYSQMWARFYASTTCCSAATVEGDILAFRSKIIWYRSPAGRILLVATSIPTHIKSCLLFFHHGQSNVCWQSKMTRHEFGLDVLLSRSSPWPTRACWIAVYTYGLEPKTYNVVQIDPKRKREKWLKRYIRGAE